MSPPPLSTFESRRWGLLLWRAACTSVCVCVCVHTDLHVTGMSFCRLSYACSILRLA